MAEIEEVGWASIELVTEGATSDGEPADLRRAPI